MVISYNRLGKQLTNHERSKTEKIYCAKITTQGFMRFSKSKSVCMEHIKGVGVQYYRRNRVLPDREKGGMDL